MRYEKKYEKAVVEVSETRLNLPECQRCKKRLAGYSVEQEDGTLLHVCKLCLLEELGQ